MTSGLLQNGYGCKRPEANLGDVNPVRSIDRFQMWKFDPHGIRDSGFGIRDWGFGIGIDPGSNHEQRGGNCDDDIKREARTSLRVLGHILFAGLLGEKEVLCSRFINYFTDF